MLGIRELKMRTPEKIKKGLECCAKDVPYPCNKCPYERTFEEEWSCKLHSDTLAYIQQLEALAPPVVIGTQIFSVCYTEDNDDFCVKSGIVVEIWYNCNGWFFIEECHTGPAFKKSDIGKLIYLSREEAELACEKLRTNKPLPEPPKEG